MKCPSKDCCNEMIPRNGKYGPFFYCKEHGAVSAQAMLIMQRIRAIKKSGISSGESYRDSVCDPLMTAIEQTTQGLLGSGYSLEKFYIDDMIPGDDDNWQDYRPY